MGPSIKHDQPPASVVMAGNQFVLPQKIVLPEQQQLLEDLGMADVADNKLSEMTSYLTRIKAWSDESRNSKLCVCEEKAFSPSAVHICPVHTPTKKGRDFDRVRTQAVWQIKMLYEQPLLCFDVETMEFVTVNVLNGFRTHSDYKFVAISHLWPKPLDGVQERGDSQPWTPADVKVHYMYTYNTSRVQFTEKEKKLKDKKDQSVENWVSNKVDAVVQAVKKYYGSETQKVLVWLDLVSVNQGDPFAIRDATYAMSIAYHVSDLTLVLLDPDDMMAERWLSRRWTLQELELAHDIQLMTATPLAVTEARNKRGTHLLYTALLLSVQRESKYPQDIVYAVRGLVPPLFALPVVYDIDVFTLILRAATVCAKEGDYSLLGAGESGFPAGSLILPFWKDVKKAVDGTNAIQMSPSIKLPETLTSKSIQVATLGKFDWLWSNF
ncbi:hypothetical protein BDR26DRAFT_928107 [Obelidium mucronatum]|nr:hypothetical protein BDR26DRAFT_928107 [Obelidium mucronatum]